ncbi:hypothetical protein [Micromonospora haikouensis]
MPAPDRSPSVSVPDATVLFVYVLARGPRRTMPTTPATTSHSTSDAIAA